MFSFLGQSKKICFFVHSAAAKISKLLLKQVYIILSVRGGASAK